MSGRSSPPFDGLAPRPEEWDVVVKVKFGEALKRFNGYVNGPHFNLNLCALRSKIASAFKFGPDVDFLLNYTDEDGDVVMLDDDDDLHDAAIHQKLNPLRINIQLKRGQAGSSQNKHEANSTPMKSTIQEDPLAQLRSVIDEALKPTSKPLRSTACEDQFAKIKSAIDESMKSIPAPVPDALAKLSHDLLDAAPPQLTELIKPFLKLVIPSSSNNKPSDKHADGSFSSSDKHAADSSSSSSGVPRTQMGLRANNHQTNVMDSLGSRPLDAQNSESSEARGLKSVFVEAPVAPSAKASQGQQTTLYPSIEELLFSNSGASKSVSKGKSVIPAASSPAPSAVPTFRPTPPTVSTNELSQPRRYEPKAYSMWQPEANAKAASISRWPIPYRASQVPPPPPVAHAPPPLAHAPPPPPVAHAPPPSAHAPPPPPGYGLSPRFPGYGPSPCFPYPSRLLSSSHLYGDLGNNREGSPPHNYHRWIQCDGCGVQPIVGPRYKSNVKEDYDLCDACFRRMGSLSEYTRIDKPILPHRLSRDPILCRKIHSRSAMKSKREKLESRFILDVTVLDGTLMAPSTPFIKIWRMHNNGSIMWPLGTQLIWVGGDQFSLQTSAPLEIPMNGFPVDEEIDVAVDFVAPARPGRYISYWRLASPTGQKFGQRVWVHIQVEDPSFVSDNRAAAINLNLPPDSSGTNIRNLIDVNIEPVDQVFGEHVNSTKEELFEPLIYHEVTEPKKPDPASRSVTFASAALPPHPIIDAPSSSSSAAAFVPLVDVPAPEPVTTPVPPPVNVPTSLLPPTHVNVPAPASVLIDVVSSEPADNAHVPAPASVLIDVVSSEHVDVDDSTEEKLLKELEEMGFKQVDLNKEILRQNKYDLEQSVDDLCGVNEWDPLLAELHEMGFDDTEMNKEALTKNGGSIKRAVMDLIAREKKDK